MRSVVAFTAVMALAGIGPAGWSAADAAASTTKAPVDDVAPGVRDRPPATAPSGPGRASPDMSESAASESARTGIISA